MTVLHALSGRHALERKIVVFQDLRRRKIDDIAIIPVEEFLEQL